MARKDLDAEAVVRALAYVEEPGVLDDKRSYRRSYRALQRLFRGYVDLQEDRALAGALAVYGWMPRMMTFLDYEALRTYGEPLLGLRETPSIGDCRRQLQALSAPSLEKILRFVNGSVIGTSKFLHFWSAAGPPIWDKRVARCFGLRYWSQIDRVDRYLEYLALLERAVKQGAKPGDKLAEFLADGEEPPISDLRAIEFALFIHGQHLSNQERQG